MNNLPSRSSDPLLRQLVGRSDDIVRQARARSRSLSYSEAEIATASHVRPLLYLIPSPNQAPAVTTLFDSKLSYYHGAEPLAPLRDRDLRVLDGWFTAEEMGEIEADITESLEHRYPEPCWEDYALGFLEGFL
ncbi:hypothetical protein [Vacuolonema iberomarrocanum]|uniref:hypothetical protein n=1 Tax=Vacuolonema iberomarrocanum TaxID=3454632 RepID=UPI003F6E2846